jgi:hypothetical protein
LAGTQQYWISSEQHAKLSLLVDAAVSLSVQSDASRTHLCCCIPAYFKIAVYQPISSLLYSSQFQASCIPISFNTYDVGNPGLSLGAGIQQARNWLIYSKFEIGFYTASLKLGGIQQAKIGWFIASLKLVGIQ